MAFIKYLNFNGEDLPLPMKYDISREDIEADSSGETEAGTIQRDLVRSGVLTISVSFQLSPRWVQKLSLFRKDPSINVRYFETELLDIRETEMYMENFKSSLHKDTSYSGLWNVSFVLKEY